MKSWFWVLSSFAMAAAIAQSGATGGGQPAATIRTTTTLVQVNVVAHDAKGRAVADMTKEDFEILDRGKPQTVSVFLSERTATEAAPAAPPAPAGTFTNQTVRSAPARRGYAVILLDYLNTGFRNTARARRDAMAMVKRIGEGTALGVYTLDRYGVHVASELGPDRAAAIKAIDKAMGLPAPCHQRSLDGQGDDDMSDCVSSGSSPLRNFTSFANANRIADSLNAFEAIAGHLAGLPGRKALIWVSAAYPLQVELRAAAQDLFPEAIGGVTLFNSQVGRAMKALNNADVALYPVDSRALSSESALDYGPEEFTWGTMNFFAKSTGGVAFYGRNDLDVGMQAAAEDVQVSYTLGFYVPKDGDPGFHNLKVRSVRPGVTLRYKEGYFVEAPVKPKPAERRAAVGKALTGIVDATAIPIAVKPVRVRNSLQLRVSLRPDTLALEKKGSRWQGVIDVVMRFVKEDGNAAGAGSSRRIEFNLTQERYERTSRTGMVLSRTLDIPKDAARLRVLVRNDPSGEIGTLTIPLADVQ